jgi:hypothetical protein
MLFQMAHSPLSAIHNGSNQWTICALVSRMWHYRGGTDEGPIRHTDLVLLDTEVSADYYFRFPMDMSSDCLLPLVPHLNFFAVPVGKPHVW